MNPMNIDLARATVAARLAWALEQRQVHQFEDAVRAERRRDARLAIARWWQSRSLRRGDVGARRLAAATSARASAVGLAQLLEEAAYRVAEQGTSSERRLIEAMSEVAAESAPGAAAALVDPDGTEVSRLRAFGLLHTHLLHALGPGEHAWLFARLDGAGGLDCPGQVAA